jgi:hypothetical protein
MLTLKKTCKYLPIALILSATGLQAKTYNEELAVAPGGLLKLNTDLGAIDINSHAKDTVLVEVNVSGKDEKKMQIDINKSGDNVNINGDINRGGFGFGSTSLRVTYKITLPENYNINLDTSAGAIDIENLKGTVDAHTSGGSISVEDVEGDVNIKTSGGSLTLENIIGEINAKTSGGSIKLKLATNPIKDTQVKTSGGSITAYLAKGAALDVSAKTSGGRVSSEFSVDGDINKRSINGTINGGGAKLYLKTSGGSVHLKKI